MKAISNRALVYALSLCALAVFASVQLAKMHGQEKVARPAGVSAEQVSAQANEELPDRAGSQPPILYGNQTPFGVLPESTKPEPVTEPGSVLADPIVQTQTAGQQQQTIEPQRRTVNRQSYDFLPPEGQIAGEGILSNRGPSGLIDPGSLEGIIPEQIIPAAPPVMQSQIPVGSLPALPAPIVSNSAPIASVPVTALNVAPTKGCAVCGSKTCTICCQPKCITKTILVPKWHTVWNSIFETRYRTEIKEEAYTCLLYTSPSPRDRTRSRMPSSA